MVVDVPATFVSFCDDNSVRAEITNETWFVGRSRRLVIPIAVMRDNRRIHGPLKVGDKLIIKVQIISHRRVVVLDAWSPPAEKVDVTPPEPPSAPLSSEKLKKGYHSVSVYFDGPASRQGFVDRLSRGGFSVIPPGAAAESEALAVILGSHASNLAIEELMKRRADSQTEFFSQQMFETYSQTGEHPYDAGEKAVLDQAAHHEPLQMIFERFGFRWPHFEQIVSRKFGMSFPPMIALETVLHELGYRAGAEAESPALRRRLLARFFEKEPVSLGVDSGPGSRNRLQWMADHLAGIIRRSRPRREMKSAVEDWTADLEWLKATYYDNNLTMKFNWPSGVS